MKLHKFIISVNTDATQGDTYRAIMDALESSENVTEKGDIAMGIAPEAVKELFITDKIDLRFMLIEKRESEAKKHLAIMNTAFRIDGGYITLLNISLQDIDFYIRLVNG